MQALPPPLRSGVRLDGLLAAGASRLRHAMWRQAHARLRCGCARFRRAVPFALDLRCRDARAFDRVLESTRLARRGAHRGAPPTPVAGRGRVGDRARRCSAGLRRTRVHRASLRAHRSLSVRVSLLPSFDGGTSAFVGWHALHSFDGTLGRVHRSVGLCGAEGAWVARLAFTESSAYTKRRGPSRGDGGCEGQGVPRWRLEAWHESKRLDRRVEGST